MKVLVFPVLLVIAIVVGPPKTDAGKPAKVVASQSVKAVPPRLEAFLLPDAASKFNAAAVPENHLANTANPVPKSSTARR